MGEAGFGLGLLGLEFGAKSVKREGGAAALGFGFGFALVTGFVLIFFVALAGFGFVVFVLFDLLPPPPATFVTFFSTTAIAIVFVNIFAFVSSLPTFVKTGFKS